MHFHRKDNLYGNNGNKIKYHSKINGLHHGYLCVQWNPNEYSMCMYSFYAERPHWIRAVQRLSEHSLQISWYSQMMVCSRWNAVDEHGVHVSTTTQFVKINNVQWTKTAKLNEHDVWRQCSKIKFWYQLIFIYFFQYMLISTDVQMADEPLGCNVWG